MWVCGVAFWLGCCGLSCYTLIAGPREGARIQWQRDAMPLILRYDGCLVSSSIQAVKSGGAQSRLLLLQMSVDDVVVGGESVPRLFGTRCIEIRKQHGDEASCTEGLLGCNFNPNPNSMRYNLGWMKLSVAIVAQGGKMSYRIATLVFTGHVGK